MKILLINNVFKSGSTGNIVKNLFEKLSKTNDVFVIYGRGKKINNNRVVKKTFELESKFCHFCSLFSGNMYGGMYFSTKRIIKYIKNVNPDVVNLHCLNGYFVNIYKLLKWLSKSNIKIVLTMHADFMMTGGCGYALDCLNYINNECKNCKHVSEFNKSFTLKRTHHFYKKMQKAIYGFDKNKLKITCVSPWLEERFKQSPIYSKFFITSILNPVDDIFFEKAEHNPYEKENNILYVTPDITDYVKSGWLIKEIAKQREDLNFTIICTKDVNFDFENKNITYIKGGVSKRELRDYYAFADQTILLSKRETFSMIVAESLSCGTSVVGFKSGGPESISIAKYSLFYAFNDINSLSKTLGSNEFQKDLVKSEAFEKYNADRISKQYLDLYKSF